jgi:ADP-ribose pyrophosphatase
MPGCYASLTDAANPSPDAGMPRKKSNRIREASEQNCNTLKIAPVVPLWLAKTDPKFRSENRMTSQEEITEQPAPAVDTSTAVVSSTPAKSAKAAKPAKSAPKPKAVKAAKVKPAPPAPSKPAQSKNAPSKSVKPKPSKSSAAKPGPAKSEATKAVAKPKVKGKPGPAVKPGQENSAKILESKVVYEGKLFRVLQDHIIEPGGRESHRDVIRHNGSVVILAVDPSKRKKDPWIVVERQYRHAAGQFLWELPAGKLDAGETALAGAIRELAEETGYQAQKWSPLVEYYASPGFLGESMKVFLAEGLVAGDAHPEEDEHIDFRLVKLSDLLEMVDKGKIIDGKTLTTVLLYARKLGLKRKK